MEIGIFQSVLQLVLGLKGGSLENLKRNGGITEAEGVRPCLGVGKPIIYFVKKG